MDRLLHVIHGTLQGLPGQNQQVENVPKDTKYKHNGKSDMVNIVFDIDIDKVVCLERPVWLSKLLHCLGHVKLILCTTHGDGLRRCWRSFKALSEVVVLCKDHGAARRDALS